MMDVNIYTGLGRELLELLSGIGPHERSEWLIRLLRLAREATGASFVYLGETGREGVIRHGLIRDRLVRREEDKLLGLARVVVSRGAAVLEPGRACRRKCGIWNWHCQIFRRKWCKCFKFYHFRWWRIFRRN